MLLGWSTRKVIDSKNNLGYRDFAPFRGRVGHRPAFGRLSDLSGGLGAAGKELSADQMRGTTDLCPFVGPDSLKESLSVFLMPTMVSLVGIKEERKGKERLV
jgi:hypothetical protein